LKTLRVIILLLLCLVSVSLSNNLSSDEQFTSLDLEFMAINRIIYTFFQETAEQAKSTFGADSPWTLTYDDSKIWLFNAPTQSDYTTINSLYDTNYPIQYKQKEAAATEPINDTPHIDLYHRQYHLKNMSDSDRIDLLVYITQQLYIAYLKEHFRDTTDIPTIDYPLTNDENIALSTLEQNILINAYYRTLYPSSLSDEQTADPQSEVTELLKQFYAIRVKRWKTQEPQIQSYETSTEKMLGLSFYQAYKLLTHLEDNNQPENITPYDISTSAILHTKFYSTLDQTILDINAMTYKKAENIGFLLSYLYDFQDWQYNPQTTQDSFHAFLGNKLNLRSTEIDSLYTACLASASFPYLKTTANLAKTRYTESYEQYSQDFNIQIYFDFPADEAFTLSDGHFTSPSEKNVVYPHIEYYRYHSPDIEMDIIGQSAMFSLNRRGKNIQSTLPPDTRIFVVSGDNDLWIKVNSDSTNTGLVEILPFSSFHITHSHQPMLFTHLSFNTPTISFATYAPGELSYIDGLLTIKPTTTKSKYLIEDEYLELIQELNFKLTERGVPHDWLAQNINHPEFKVYHSLVKYFTTMPEHQVSRGERDQDWYMKSFGVEEKVRKGSAFRATHLKALQDAEKKYGIHYEMMMAIMAIESDYANPRYKGNFYAFPSLVSQYLLLPKRQRFATNELKALYDFSKKTSKEPYHFIGSFAGAVGWGQFIPTSLNAFFVDANGEFTDVDIFAIDDTIHSIAHYLTKSGLNSKNMDVYKSRYNAVFKYNNSDAYVKAVLYIYDKLHAQRGEF